MGGAKQLDRVGVDVFDLPGVSVEQQSSVSRSFKKTTVAAYRRHDQEAPFRGAGKDCAGRRLRAVASLTQTAPR
jgi:hypothetical protein